MRQREDFAGQTPEKSSGELEHVSYGVGPVVLLFLQSDTSHFELD